MVLSPLGDSALIISLGEEVDDAVASRVRSVADALERAHFPGLTDIVPAFADVTVYYDIGSCGDFRVFEARIAEVAKAASDSILRVAAKHTVEIPVCYGGEHGPDIEEVAKRAGASLEQVIEWHSNTDYRVHAIGFVPGFAYLGGLPRKLHMPRRPTPRQRVVAGSVGIGGAQTGVYPIETPGGWNLIGRTPLVMFEAAKTKPAVLHTGDRVKFRAISPEEFAAWK